MSDLRPFRCPRCHGSNWTVHFALPASRSVDLFTINPDGPVRSDEEPLVADFAGCNAGAPASYHCEDYHQNVFPDGTPALPLG